jgi:BolA protein
VTADPLAGDRASRVDRIRAAIEAALAPASLAVVDDSARHAGHAGARDGRGHFNVEVVAEAFAGRAPLARHRMVYAAVGTLMDTDIHALSIRALTPAEAAAH